MEIDEISADLKENLMVRSALIDKFPARRSWGESLDGSINNHLPGPGELLVLPGQGRVFRKVKVFVRKKCGVRHYPVFDHIHIPIPVKPPGELILYCQEAQRGEVATGLLICFLEECHRIPEFRFIRLFVEDDSPVDPDGRMTEHLFAHILSAGKIRINLIPLSHIPVG